MNDNTKTENEFEQAHAEAQQAAEQQVNIAGQVRDITLNALTQGTLDGERIKKVIHAVMDGVSVGASNKQGKVNETMKEALSGVDQALAKTAEASKLALEEAVGKVKDYNNEDLQKALDDLKDLESILFDTVGNVAKSSGHLAKETLNDLISHAKQSGTGVGEQSRKIAETFTSQMGQTTREAVSAGADAAKILSSHVAEVASGFLSGLADSIKSKDETKK